MSVRTIKDIAKICNCSTSTVSRAINGESGINKKTRERILQVIEEYNFIPNSSARELKKIESNTIALLIQGMDNPFFHSAFSIFEEELKKCFEDERFSKHQKIGMILSCMFLT